MSVSGTKAVDKTILLISEKKRNAQLGYRCGAEAGRPSCALLAVLEEAGGGY